MLMFFPRYAAALMLRALLCYAAIRCCFSHIAIFRCRYGAMPHIRYDECRHAADTAVGHYAAAPF